MLDLVLDSAVEDIIPQVLEAMPGRAKLGQLDPPRDTDLAAGDFPKLEENLFGFFQRGGDDVDIDCAKITGASQFRQQHMIIAWKMNFRPSIVGVINSLHNADRLTVS